MRGAQTVLESFKSLANAASSSCFRIAVRVAAACDATVTPVVTGHIDWTVLDELTRVFVKAYGRGLDHRRGQQAGPGNRTGHGRKREQEPPEICPATRKRLRDTLLQMSIDLLSGPGGVASCLWVTTLGEPHSSLSQPLDMGGPHPGRPAAPAQRPHSRTSLGLETDCHPDGITTATGPDGRVLHSHGPPSRAA
jgi:hypothetical protein